MGSLPFPVSLGLFAGRMIEHVGPFLAIFRPEVDHDNEEGWIDFPI